LKISSNERICGCRSFLLVNDFAIYGIQVIILWIAIVIRTNDKERMELS